MSKIEWTGETWNPLVGCTIHSAGCKGCYAMKDAYRLMHNPHPAISAKFAGTAKMVNGHAVWTGRINFDEATLLKPLKRRVPTTYFVNSMSDLFHQAVTDDQIDRIFAVMALCPQHTFQVLSKRADRMRAYLTDLAWPERVSKIVNSWPEKAIGTGNEFAGDFALCFGGQLPNVWLGVSVEDQRAADERIPDLLSSPASVRFLSCEPLIGPVNLTRLCLVPRLAGSSRAGIHVDALDGRYVESGCAYIGEWDINGPYPTGAPAVALDWVICGGESGRTARPMHPSWARWLRDQCAQAGVPFFFKQWGEWGPDEGPRADGSDPVMEGRVQCAVRVGDDWQHFRDGYEPPIELCTGHGQHVYRFGKKANGRLLEGAEHNGMPAHG